MPLTTDFSFGLIDLLIFLGFVIMAVLGGIYFLSPSFREEKRQKWEREGEMKAVSEWGEWLLGLLFVAVLLGAAIGYALHK